MVAIEASSSALLMGDVTAGRAALTRATQANVDDDDLVYVALWLQLLERQAKEKPSSSEATTKALRSVKSGPSWTSKLAQWGLGKLDDAALVAGARDVSQRTEAAFYVAMRKHVQGDAQALLELERIAKGSAIQLVETHIAQELTAPTGRPPMGQPPATLP
jgi:lipoprotein NlpI